MPSPPRSPREPLSEELRQDLFGRDSYVPVFVLALLVVVGFPIGDAYHWGFLATVPLLAFTILLAFHRSHVSRRFLSFATAAVVIVGVLSLGAATLLTATGVEERWLLTVTSTLIGGLILLALPAITREAFRHRRVSINTLAAAVTAYLFIGFLFTSIFRLIFAIEGVPFFHTVADDPQLGEFSYFSFVTLTTLGYGDYTAATDAGRAAAVLEAILGQVFLVTAVARIVSLLGQERRDPAQFEEPGPGDIDPDDVDPDPDPDPDDLRPA